MSTNDFTCLKQLTKDELAERLGVSKRTIEHMVNRGELPKGRRLGRDVYWLESVVHAWQLKAFAEQINWSPRAGAFRRP